MTIGWTRRVAIIIKRSGQAEQFWLMCPILIGYGEVHCDLQLMTMSWFNHCIKWFDV